MLPENTGKVIIRAIPDDAVKERVVAFICRHGGRVAPDQVTARLNSLPLVLAGSIEKAKGESLAAALNGLGAEAVFVGSAEQLSPVTPPPVVGNDTAEPPARDRSPAPGPARPDRGRGRESRKDAAAAAELEKLRIAHACRIALVYALLACLAAMTSPLFYLFAVPLALYACHRAAALLEVDIWLRIIYLPGVFVPVMNLCILSLLLLQTHLFVRRRKPVGEAAHDELAPLRFAFRLSYAAFMAIFLIGTGSGFLPESMEELRETVERRLEKDVALAAKQFPRTVDKDLRIDRMSAGPARRLTFHCTLLHYRAKTVDAERFRANISTNIVKQVCGSKEMKYYLKKDVVIAYAFNGSDEQPITTIDVGSADCER